MSPSVVIIGTTKCLSQPLQFFWRSGTDIFPNICSNFTRMRGYMDNSSSNSHQVIIKISRPSLAPPCTCNMWNTCVFSCYKKSTNSLKYIYLASFVLTSAIKTIKFHSTTKIVSGTKPSAPTGPSWSPRNEWVEDNIRISEWRLYTVKPLI